jgi:hypothetical protein
MDPVEDDQRSLEEAFGKELDRVGKLLHECNEYVSTLKDQFDAPSDYVADRLKMSKLEAQLLVSLFEALREDADIASFLTGMAAYELAQQKQEDPLAQEAREADTAKLEETVDSYEAGVTENISREVYTAAREELEERERATRAE